MERSSPAQILEAVMRASSDGVAITDSGGRIVEASDSFWSLLEWSRDGPTESKLPDRLEEFGVGLSRIWGELEERVLISGTGVCEFAVPTERGVRRLKVTASPFRSEGRGANKGLVSVWHDVTERSLEKGKRRLTQIAVDRATECILSMRPDGRIFYANQAACRMLGYPLEQLLSLKIHDVDSGLMAEQWPSQWADIERRGAYTVESLFRTQDGNTVPVEVSISHRSVGPDSFAIAVARDITKRREAEEALRLIEDRYSMATRAARTGVWDWDLRTGEFFVDPIIMHLLGYAEDDIPKDMESWTNHIHPDDRQTADDAAASCLAGTEEEYSLEHRMLHKDESVRWIFARGKVVRNAAGTPIRVVGTNTDVTERRQAEEELREFRVIADNANYGMAVADLAGTLLYVNKNFAGVHGYTVDELLGENLSVLHSPGQLDLVNETNAGLIRDGKFGPTEIWHAHKNGRAFPMLMNGITIPDDRGAPMIIAATAIDISARVRAERALEIREHQQAVVATLGRQALAGSELEQLLRDTAKAVAGTLNIRMCAVVELGADGDTFLLREGVGWRPGNVGQVLHQAGPDWQGARALRLSKTIAVEKIGKEPRSRVPALFREHEVVSAATVPIRGWGRPYGVLVACESSHRVFDADDVNFLEGVANILAHALERRQAEEALAVSQERLRNLAARLHAVREEERTVIAREIHDQLGQALTGMKMDLSWLVRRLPDDEAVRERVNAMEALLDATVDSVRMISTQLRPPILDDLGLEAAVEWHAQEFSRLSGVKCKLKLQIGDRLVRDEHATAAFRILQEALVNVTRHARAENVDVEVRVVENALLLVVSDDGCGIGEAALSSSRSIGLIGMRERASALGGNVAISRLPAGGTCVKLELPLERDNVGEPP